MVEIENFISPVVQDYLDNYEQEYLSHVFDLCGGFPTLNQL